MEKNLTPKEILTLNGIIEKIIRNISKHKIVIPLDLHYKIFSYQKELTFAEDFIFNYLETNNMIGTIDDNDILDSVKIPVNLFELNKTNRHLIEDENILRLDEIDLYEFKTILS